jgi:hypothetical protein
MAEAYEDIHVEFSVSRNAYEDISILYETVGIYYNDIGLEFHIDRWDAYNFNNIGVVFEIMQGLMYENISLIFSVVKAPQSFMSYIFQKLYCTTTEVGTVYEDVQLLDWNVKPNQTWFVAVDYYQIALYATQDDMTNNTNAVAYGTVDSSTLTAILYTAEDETIPLEFYYQDYPYHLSVSEIINSGTRMFKVKPLTDLSEIRHPIYNNSNIALSRGEAELNLHTYAKLGREIVLGIHLPELEVGDAVELTSVRRNKTEISQVLSQTISGEVSDGGETSLITSIQVANYLELTR